MKKWISVIVGVFVLSLVVANFASCKLKGNKKSGRGNVKLAGFTYEHTQKYVDIMFVSDTEYTVSHGAREVMARGTYTSSNTEIKLNVAWCSPEMINFIGEDLTGQQVIFKIINARELNGFGGTWRRK